jgi:hypothetical protein
MTHANDDAVIRIICESYNQDAGVNQCCQVIIGMGAGALAGEIARLLPVAPEQNEWEYGHRRPAAKDVPFHLLNRDDLLTTLRNAYPKTIFTIKDGLMSAVGSTP